nr:MAG TPA: hypothetical protein [Bacteriophage sp.]
MYKKKAVRFPVFRQETLLSAKIHSSQGNTNSLYL